MSETRCPKKQLDRVSLDRENNEPGVYEVLSSGDEVLYVGCGPLRSMISEHLDEGAFPLGEAKYYRTFSSPQRGDLEKSRRTLIEDHEFICGKKPRYNL